MSISLTPASVLGFRHKTEPLSVLVKRSLTITNNNPLPITFIIKTTVPELYSARPNSGRIEPGGSIDVSVALRAIKLLEWPFMNTELENKFLIYSTIITPDIEELALRDMWVRVEKNEAEMFLQKLRVVYLQDRLHEVIGASFKSVSLSPSSVLGFRRPLTIPVERSLTVTNNNPLPVIFKVKTKAPTLYCVSPNLERVEPGKSVDVLITLQALKEEPPLDTECEDKFLILSTVITPEKENQPLHDIWASVESDEGCVVFMQKLRVLYLQEPLYDLMNGPFNCVYLSPSSTLSFKRPLTTIVERSLTITNDNPLPAAFKVKTTNSKLYSVKPNIGRIEPRESIEVLITLQGRKEEPPLNKKCQDKFRIQSTVIQPEMENLSLRDIWDSVENDENGKFFAQKLRVTYIPIEGQTPEEDEDTTRVISDIITLDPDTMKATFEGNTVIPTPGPGSSSSQETARGKGKQRASSPTTEAIYHEAQPALEVQTVPTFIDEQPKYTLEPTLMPASTAIEPEHDLSAPGLSLVHTPAAEAPESIDLTRENTNTEEIITKYKMALEEIERFKAQVASLTTENLELKRRIKYLPDDASEVVVMYAGLGDMKTMAEWARREAIAARFQVEKVAEAPSG